MKLLVDSDFLISLFRPDDSNHAKASDIYKNIESKSELVALSLVFQESSTVMSKRFGMNEAIRFYGLVRKLVDKDILLDKDLEKDAWNIFLKQNKKGTSFIDCANLATLEKFKLDGILSFDEFYPKGVKITS